MAYILVVDDDDIVAEYAAGILMNAGHACGWVGDAEAAMDVLGQRRPDLVLLDHDMPGESGVALLRRMRNSPRLYDLPVAMFTGSVGAEEEQIARYSGAQDYIRKPFVAEMLVLRVEAILKKRQSKPRHRTLAQNVGVEQAPIALNPVRMVG